MHDGGCLAGQVDPRLSLQSELGKILVIAIHAQALPHVNEHRVAGIHGALQKGFGPVSPHFMAPYLPVLHHPESGTGKLVCQLHHT